MKCAYCIVPTTRGPERCRPIADIVEEARELVAKGTREITLLGQIVNSYGKREITFLGTKSPFVQLLEALHEIPGLDRIRFTSPHPSGFKQDLIEAFGRLPKLGSYVHLPLQSGSDRILKAMNRPYTTAAFRNIVHALRAQVPHIHLSTDIIVGFPGETDEDFEATCAFFEEMAFDMGFIFKYSVRSGTPAESLGDPISPEIKEERNKILLQVLEKQTLLRNQSLVGSSQEILVEEPARKGGGLFMGRTWGNKRVLFPGADRLIGQTVTVQITEATLGHLKGELAILD